MCTSGHSIVTMFVYFFFWVILDRMKETRLSKQSDGDSEIIAWVNKSRKLEEKKNAEREKALQLSKVFEEQVSFFLFIF